MLCKEGPLNEKYGNIKCEYRYLKIGYSRICACAGYVYIFCFDQL